MNETHLKGELQNLPFSELDSRLSKLFYIDIENNLYLRGKNQGVNHYFNKEAGKIYSSLQLGLFAIITHLWKLICRTVFNCLLV